jgi:hypothetical protein
MERDGYGPRRKSAWVREAINGFLEEEKRTGFAKVGVGDAVEKHKAIEVIRLDEATIERIEATVRLIRRQAPMMEGVRSAIVRAAIRWRVDTGCGSAEPGSI